MDHLFLILNSSYNYCQASNVSRTFIYILIGSFMAWEGVVIDRLWWINMSQSACLFGTGDTGWLALMGSHPFGVSKHALVNNIWASSCFSSGYVGIESRLRGSPRANMIFMIIIKKHSLLSRTFSLTLRIKPASSSLYRRVCTRSFRVRFSLNMLDSQRWFNLYKKSSYYETLTSRQ